MCGHSRLHTSLISFAVNTPNAPCLVDPNDLLQFQQVIIVSQVTRVSEAYLKEDVKDVVITIPSYYTHSERSAIVAGAASTVTRDVIIAPFHLCPCSR